MPNSDTIELLRECSSGAAMGISSIDDILESTKDEKLKSILQKSKDNHETLETDIENYLKAFHDEPKEPGTMAKGMSYLKTNFKMTANPSDKTIADLITDGCNMGIKSLYRYLNQYQAAEQDVKKLAKRLIDEEENLRKELCSYL